jgi:hypothetical protein
MIIEKINIGKELYNDITNYCLVNQIINIENYLIKMIKQGHTVEKFGSSPNVKEKIVEKIVEVEKIIEIEKIVEVKIEVPIEKIVEKEVYITDNSETSVLTKKIGKLENKITDNNLEHLKICNSFEEKIDLINKELIDKNNIIEALKKEIEKNKNKKDFYGE